MTELSDIITREVQRLASEEAIQAYVAKKIDECIKNAVDTAMRSWGGVGKQIDEAVAKSLALPAGIDLPEFGHMLLALLRSRMEGRIDQLLADHITAEMDEILALGRREIRLSEMVGEMVKSITEEEPDRHGEYMTVVVEPSFPSSDVLKDCWNISIDEDGGIDPRKCSLRFSVGSGGKISTLSLNGTAVHTQMRVSGLYGPAKSLFCLYATGGKFIVDDRTPSTYIGRD